MSARVLLNGTHLRVCRNRGRRRTHHVITLHDSEKFEHEPTGDYKLTRVRVRRMAICWSEIVVLIALASINLPLRISLGIHFPEADPERRIKNVNRRGKLNLHPREHVSTQPRPAGVVNPLAALNRDFKFRHLIARSYVSGPSPPCIKGLNHGSAAINKFKPPRLAASLPLEGSKESERGKEKASPRAG